MYKLKTRFIECKTHQVEFEDGFLAGRQMFFYTHRGG